MSEEVRHLQLDVGHHVPGEVQEVREKVQTEVLVRDPRDQLAAQHGKRLSPSPVVAVGQVLRQVDHDVPGQVGMVGVVEAGEHDRDDRDSGLAD